MKNKKLLSALELADDKYIDEAAPGRMIKKKRHFNPKVWGVVAACFCTVMIGFNLWLFVPFNTEPPSVEKYSESEYYEIIQRINALTYRAPRYKNNYEKYFRNKMFSVKNYSMEMDAAETVLETGLVTDGATGEPTSGKYEEVTDNQVAGIIESDLIKRSDTHIFYLSGNTITAYSIDGESSEAVGSYVISGRATNIKGFYLSTDCTVLTVIRTLYNEEYSQHYVELVSVDVTDPTDMKRADTVSVSGSYLSSRLVDGELLLLTRYNVSKDLDFGDETTFVPQIQCGEEGSESIPMEGIVYPDKLTSTQYTVVCKIDQRSLEVSGESAFLSYSENVYVSAENIFVTREYRTEYEPGDGWIWKKTVTEISYITYDGFDHVGATTLDGYVKDQYSLDQNGDILRVVTTTSDNRYKRTDDVSEYTAEIAWIGGTSANLYCIDIESGEIISSVVGFAPKGETVRSVRFEGDCAYVCTAVEITDPVFFFDLRDHENITYKDTGTITGFSTSLVNMGGGYLLGVGIGDNSVKIEIYTETDTGVKSVCKYEYKNASYSFDYKSYYIDRANQLIGLGIEQYENYSNVRKEKYVVLQFDGSVLREVVSAEVTGDNQNKRGVYIEGYMYMFGTNGLTVKEIK